MQTDKQQIIKLLSSDKSEDIREGAFLAGNGKLVDAVPLLVGHIENVNPGVQGAVDSALRKIGGQNVLYAVLPYLRSEDPPVRNMAMDLLREVGNSNVTALTELLADEDPDIRIFGADILGATGSVMAVPALGSALLRDREVNVRYQAAVSLGNLAFPEAADSLNHALNDEEWVQFAVIEALTKVRAESSVDALARALDKSSELVASVIVDAIAEMGYIKAVPLLMKRLPEANVPMANKLVRAILKIVGPRSLSLVGKDAQKNMMGYMLQALQDEDVDIQDAAIQGLTATSNDDAYTAVFNLLLTLNVDKDQERMLHIIDLLAAMGYNHTLEDSMEQADDYRKMVAIEIMGKLDAPEVKNALKKSFWEQPRDVQRGAAAALLSRSDASDTSFFLDMLEHSTDGDLLKAAIIFLGKQKDAEVVKEKIFPLLHHPYDDVKEAALESCIAAKNSSINEEFRKMATSAEEFERMMAMHALGRYGVDENIEFLKVGLKDDSSNVRKITVEAMNDRQCPVTEGRVTLLEPLLDDDNRDVRLAVLDLLGSCTEPRSVNYLLSGLKDDDAWIRARCAEKLGVKHVTSAADTLADLLNDEHTLVVVKAIEALAELGGEHAFTHLLPLVDHPDGDIQRAAEDALDKVRKSGEK